jgi:hypothetical protein
MEFLERLLEQDFADLVVGDDIGQGQAFGRAVLDMAHVEVKPPAVEEKAAVAGRFVVIAVVQIDQPELFLFEDVIAHPGRDGGKPEGFGRHTAILGFQAGEPLHALTVPGFCPLGKSFSPGSPRTRRQGHRVRRRSGVRRVSPTPGTMDCSNTSRYLYKVTTGIELPRTASDQYYYLHLQNKAWDVPQTPTALPIANFLRQNLKPGDLLFWENTYRPERQPPITHVMVFLGTNEKGASGSWPVRKPAGAASTTGATAVPIFMFSGPTNRAAVTRPGWGWSIIRAVSAPSAVRSKPTGPSWAR